MHDVNLRMLVPDAPEHGLDGGQQGACRRTKQAKKSYELMVLTETMATEIRMNLCVSTTASLMKKTRRDVNGVAGSHGDIESDVASELSTWRLNDEQGWIDR